MLITLPNLFFGGKGGIFLCVELVAYSIVSVDDISAFSVVGYYDAVFLPLVFFVAVWLLHYYLLS